MENSKAGDHFSEIESALDINLEEGNRYDPNASDPIMDENFVHTSSPNFWEIGNFANTLRRAERAIPLLNAITRIFDEKANLEIKIGKMLMEWNKKFKSIFETFKSNDPNHIFVYGDLREMLNAAVLFDEERARAHMEGWNKIHANIITPISEYNTNNCRKQGNQMGGYGIKDIEALKSEFIAAQRPWNEVIHKVNKTKAKFHRISTNSSYASFVDKFFADEENLEVTYQKNKMSSRSSKSKKKTFDKTLKEYTEALDHMNALSQLYKEKMMIAFNSAQNKEIEKLNILKNLFQEYTNVYNHQKDKRYAEASEALNQLAHSFDPNTAVLEWSSKHGAHMPLVLPEFELIPPAKNKKKHSKNTRSGSKSIPLDRRSTVSKNSRIFQLQSYLSKTQSLMEKNPALLNKVHSVPYITNTTSSNSNMYSMKSTPMNMNRILTKNKFTKSINDGLTQETGITFIDIDPEISHSPKMSRNDKDLSYSKKESLEDEAKERQITTLTSNFSGLENINTDAFANSKHSGNNVSVNMDSYAGEDDVIGGAGVVISQQADKSIENTTSSTTQSYMTSCSSSSKPTINIDGKSGLPPRNLARNESTLTQGHGILGIRESSKLMENITIDLSDFETSSIGT